MSKLINFDGFDINSGLTKCGEIIVTIEMEKKIYALKCLFCETSSLQLEEFAFHFEEQHEKIAKKLEFNKDVKILNTGATIERIDEDFEEQFLSNVKFNVNTTVVEEDVPEHSSIDLVEESSLDGENLDLDFIIETHEVVPNNPNFEYDNLEYNKDDNLDSDEDNSDFNDDDDDDDDDEDLNPSVKQTNDKSDELNQVLLEALKNEPVLWDVDDENACNRNARKAAHTRISIILKEKLNLVYSVQRISALTRHICQKYRDEKFKESKNATRSSSKASSSKTQVAPKFGNKKFMTTFLEELKKETILWDLQLSRTNNEERKIKKNEANMRIIMTLKDKLNIVISPYKIYYFVKHLRKKYRDLLNKLDKASKMGVEYTPPWYYEKLSFLQPLKTVTVKPDFISKFTNAQKVALIEILSQFPNLWDVNHIEYHFEEYKNQSLNDVLLALNTQTNLNITADELKLEIKHLESICSKEKKEKLRCEENDEIYVPRNSLYGSLAFLEPNVPPFLCPFCGDKKNFINQFKEHVAEHEGLKPFDCTICGTRLRNLANYKVHLRRHLGIYNYSCEICEKRFASATELTIHLRFHTRERPFCCELCGESYTTSSMLIRHKKVKHGQKDFQCSICMKKFYERSELNHHQLRVHENIRDEVCHICGKGFYHRKDLVKHQETHKKKKCYICKICKKTFNKRLNLLSHMKMHE